jgi:hypothetical protein
MTEDHDTETADVQLSITLPADWSARERRRVETEATRLRRTIEEQLASGMSPCDVAALFREYGAFEYVTLDERDDGSIYLDVRDRAPDEAESDPAVTDGGRDLEERRVEALEEISAQLRYQNAAICELIRTVEEVGLAATGRIEPRSETRSLKGIQTSLDDHDFTRQEKFDDEDDLLGRDFR